MFKTKGVIKIHRLCAVLEKLFFLALQVYFILDRKEEGRMRNYQTALVLDFDGTVADTLKPSPSGLGVVGAYELAILKLFGEKACRAYKQAGGLQNRSPREVVVELQQAGFEGGSNTTALTDALVGLKIDCLTNEIGKPLEGGDLWPRLTTGFASSWRQVRTNTSTFTAILSSGHQAFIRRTFEVHGLECPDFMVTDDELRALPKPLSKPDAGLWRYLLRESQVSFSNALYIGDDRVKDGGLARNSGVPFLLFAPAGTPEYGNAGTFADWRDVLPRFARGGAM